MTAYLKYYIKFVCIYTQFWQDFIYLKQLYPFQNYFLSFSCQKIYVTSNRDQRLQNCCSFSLVLLRIKDWKISLISRELQWEKKI